MRILLVEDDPSIASGIAEAFRRRGDGLDVLGRAEPALAALVDTAYDLAIIDIGLPGMSGLELVQALRRRGIAIPLMLLTARDTVEDRVRGLHQGADDYLVKPFALDELLARCVAVIRRSHALASSTLGCGSLGMDLGSREATLGNTVLELTAREWVLLEQLMMAAPNVVAKARLVETLGAWDREITVNAVEILVSRLRTKLDGSDVEVRTMRGLGYRIAQASLDAVAS